MKKISTFIGLFLILFSLLAQTTTPKRKNKNQNKEQKKQRILTNAIKYGLDSLVLANEEKYTYKYDTQGNVTENIEYYWEGKWIIGSKITKKYNDKGDVLFLNDFEDGDEYLLEYEYTYDTKGNISEEIETETYEGKIQGKDKIVNTYDAQGNKTQLIIYNLVVDKWVETYKTVNIYDTQGNHTNEENYNYKNDTWKLSKKITNTYDTNNNNTKYEESSWDDKNNVRSDQKEYKYDANKNVIEVIHYNWNSSTSTFDFREKVTYSYNGKNQDTGAIIYTYDLANSKWVNDQKEEYSNHDVNNNSNLIIHYTWDKDNSVWLNETKFVDTYDYSVAPSDVFMLDELFEDYLGKITQENIYYWKNDAWDLSETIDYYYSTEGISSINEEVNLTTQVYPNPFTSELSINFESISQEANFELFDVQGKKVFSTMLKNEELIDVSSLSKGIYFYQLITNDVIQRGQLVK